MKISDLQYIETIDNSELKGGTKGNSAFAGGGAGALALGNDSSAVTATVLVADAVNGFSLSGSGGSATAST